jgi:hypothetical protein
MVKLVAAEMTTAVVIHVAGINTIYPFIIMHTYSASFNLRLAFLVPLINLQTKIYLSTLIHISLNIIMD